MVHTTFTNNMRSNAILRKEIIKGFPRNAHIKRKHNKDTGSTETQVTEKGILLLLFLLLRRLLLIIIIQLALQPLVGFGLLYDFVPQSSIFTLLSPVSHFHLL